MSLSDKEKVLQYILSQKISPDGKLFLSAKRYCEIDDISPNEFIKQLFALQDDGLISVYFHGQSNASTATDLSIYPKALTYFDGEPPTTLKGRGFLFRRQSLTISVLHNLHRLEIGQFLPYLLLTYIIN